MRRSEKGFFSSSESLTIINLTQMAFQNATMGERGGWNRERERELLYSKGDKDRGIRDT